MNRLFAISSILVETWSILGRFERFLHHNEATHLEVCSTVVQQFAT